MFNCEHKNKIKLPVILSNTADIILNDYQATYNFGEYQIYLCMDCKCVVWEEKINE